MSNLLCKNCGKMYDAEKDLRYWYNRYSGTQSSNLQAGCIHCGYMYPYSEKSKWSAACLSTSPDVPVFDDQLDTGGLCPPTVFKRFKALLDELMDKHREVPDAQVLLDEVWAEWRTQ